jgi:hypothetical protein
VDQPSSISSARRECRRGRRRKWHSRSRISRRPWTFERFEIPGFDAQGDTIAAPDNYPSKGTGELGTFFYDSEGNLIGIAQPIREGSTR